MADVRALTTGVLPRRADDRRAGGRQVAAPFHDVEELAIPEALHRFVGGMVTRPRELLHLGQKAALQHGVDAPFDASGDCLRAGVEHDEHQLEARPRRVRPAHRGDGRAVEIAEPQGAQRPDEVVRMDGRGGLAIGCRERAVDRARVLGLTLAPVGLEGRALGRLGVGLVQQIGPGAVGPSRRTQVEAGAADDDAARVRPPLVRMRGPVAGGERHVGIDEVEAEVGHARACLCVRLAAADVEAAVDLDRVADEHREVERTGDGAPERALAGGGGPDESRRRAGVRRSFAATMPDELVGPPATHARHLWEDDAGRRYCY